MQSYILIQGARWIQSTFVACYKALQNHLDAADVFQPILLNDFAPADTQYENMCIVYFILTHAHTHSNIYVESVLDICTCRQRRTYIDNLKGEHCMTTGMVYSYSTGNSPGSIRFVWKFGGDVTPEAITQGNAECIRIIQPSLPVYHTRAMRKDFFNTVELFKCGKPAVLWGIYKCLTGTDVFVRACTILCVCTILCTIVAGHQLCVKPNH